MYAIINDSSRKRFVALKDHSFPLKRDGKVFIPRDSQQHSSQIEYSSKRKQRVLLCYLRNEHFEIFRRVHESLDEFSQRRNSMSYLKFFFRSYECRDVLGRVTRTTKMCNSRKQSDLFYIFSCIYAILCISRMTKLVDSWLQDNSSF